MGSEGWTKKNAKYVKKIPKPGGGFYYVYPEDLKKQVADKTGLTARKNLKTAESNYSKAKSNFKNQLQTNKGLSGASSIGRKATGDALKTRKSKMDEAKKTYNGTLAGKTEKFLKDAGEKTKKAVKTTATKVSDAIGLDERADYKKSRGFLTKAYKKNRYDETIAGKVEKAISPVVEKAKRIKDEVGETASFRKAIKNPGESYEFTENGKKRYLTAVGDHSAVVTRTKVAGKILGAPNVADKKIKKAASSTARALAIDDDVERIKKKAKKEKVKKKLKKSTKKAKKKIEKWLKG